MLQGPGPADPGAQFLGTNVNVAGPSRVPQLQGQAPGNASGPSRAPQSQGQAPANSYAGGGQPQMYGSSKMDGNPNSQVMLNPSMLASLVPGTLPIAMSQLGCAVPSRMALGISSLPGGTPQFPLTGLPALPPRAGVDSPLLPNGVPLMNVNISNSHFLKAMNFDAMSNKATTGCGDDERLTDDENDDVSQYDQSEDDGLLEESPAAEPNADLIEQQQATAQAQLLDRFKQLRQWQASQQELLMRQQQEQLAMLHEEQSRVQMLIVKQRENQWGAGVSNPSATPSKKSPAKKPPQHPQSTLPHAIAQSTLALAKVNNCGETNGEALQEPHTPRVVKGRPVPNIASGPSTPLEYLEHGNPSLDSDSNTVASGTPLEDGVQRLLDTASECSEAPGAGPAYFHSVREMSEEERRHRANSGKKYGPPIPFPHVDEEEHAQRQKCFGNDVLLGLTGSQTGQSSVRLPLFQSRAEPAFAEHQNRLAHNHGMAVHRQPPAPLGGRVENSESNAFEFKEDHREDLNDDSQDNCNQDEEFEFLQDDDDDYEEQEEENECVLDERYALTEEELNNGNMEDDDDRSAAGRLDPEDKPVVGTKKTFEQLLEEELRKEEARQRSEADVAASSGTKKKAFLRRGEGLARFGVGSKNRPQKKTTSKQSPRYERQASKHSGNGIRPTMTRLTSVGHANSEMDSAPIRKTTEGKKTSPPSKVSAPSSAAAPGSRLPPANAGSHSFKAKATPLSNPSKPQYLPPPAQKSNSPQKLLGTSAPKTTATTTRHVTAAVQTSSRAQSTSTVTDVQPKDSTGEMSFQRCMQDREKHDEIENEELEEFEILEQFADDDASFLSSVSVVNQVLSKEKKAKSSHTGHSLSGHQTSPSGDVQSESDDDDELNTTLQGSPPDNQICYEHDTSNEVPVALQRKVSQLENRSPSKGKTSNRFASKKPVDDSDIWEEFEGDDGENLADSDQSDGSSSEESSSDTDAEDGFDVRDVILHSKFDEKPAEENAASSGVLGLTSYPVRSPPQASGAAQNDEPSSSPANRAATPSQTSQNEFGDDEEWQEMQKARVQGPSSSGAPDPVAKTRVFPERNDVGQVDTSTTPPTSKLVTKLFPKLKPDKPKKSPVTIEQQQQLLNAKQVPLGDGVQSKALRDKLVELEREIERFRKENASLELLRREREEGLEHLKKEMEEFEKQKAEELQRLQEYKNEEMKKLKKERRIFDQYQKASRAMPDKKDREEIESLKKQVKALQDELKHKEQRWTASTSRLRDRLEYVERENSELKEEIKLLEKKRLEAWQQKETSLPAKSEKKLDTHPHSGVQQPHFDHKASQGSRQSTASSVVGSQASKSLASSQNNRNHVIRTAGEAEGGDAGSELPDSASRVVTDLDVTNDESLVMQTVPQATTRGHSKHMDTGPHQAIAAEPSGGQPPGSRVNMPRKMATAANISQTIDKGDEKYEELQHADGKIERIYCNGAREILFSNGTRKQVSADGQSIIVSFFNGDIKEIMPDQRVIYYYADAQTTHTTYPDGLEIIQFPNNQIEKHYPDGTREITFPDQTIKYLFPTGVEESIFPDGTVVRVERNGDKVMEFPNGQREIHTPQYKRREYPDGTVKTVYPDGRQETRYSSGRIRVKDRDGQVVIDRRV